MTTKQPLADPSTRDDEMSAGEFRTVVDSLGFTLTGNGSFATYLAREDEISDIRSVEKNVCRWDAGSHLVPPTVREKLLRLEEYTEREVDRLTGSLANQTDPVAVVFRNDHDMWNAHPKYAPLPARWWRRVVYEAARNVPGTRIAYPDDIID